MCKPEINLSGKTPMAYGLFASWWLILDTMVYMLWKKWLVYQCRRSLYTPLILHNSELGILTHGDAIVASQK